jgi:hypothetical protein
MHGATTKTNRKGIALFDTSDMDMKCSPLQSLQTDASAHPASRSEDFSPKVKLPVGGADK